MTIYMLITVLLLFIWPIIVSICCLIVKGQQISSKFKYFLTSSFVGYVLIFLAQIFGEKISARIDNETLLNTVTIILYYVPTVIVSYKLAIVSSERN